ncbi:alcohol oxidase-like protein [Mucidula mucida]|nr:alcohol oxidase-like protein [Mucidula mucida]
MAAPHSIDAEYDIVFAGGGTSACVTASRLAQAAPELRILVLESGPTTKDKLEHIQPGQYLTHLAPTSTTMQFYTSPPSEYLAGRSAIVPSGRCIGGGSSVNFALYNRPAASDFDAWETDFGNPGWSSKDLIPLLQKAETYEIDPTKATHGSDGPLKVSYGGPNSVMNIGKQFLDIGPKFEKKRPLSDEANGFGEESVNVFYLMPKWISSDGQRSDVAHHYIYHKGLQNLSVLDGCLVNRVIVEDGIATGVEYSFDIRVYPSSPQDQRIVRAKKLVVVSAGAMGSPLILERSGIGRKDVLEKAGIPLVVDLPGVGSDYQDHAFYVTPYIADPAETTFDGIYRGDPEEWAEAQKQWHKDGGGRLGGNTADGCIKMRPLPEELEELGPEFVEHFNKAYADKPDKPLLWMCASSGLPADQTGLPALNYTCICLFLGYPESRGSMHVSSVDPYTAPHFESGFLTKSVDVAALRWGYKKGREIIRRLPAFRGALVPAHPQFAADSPAALVETGPIPLDAPKIVYSAEDDAAIDHNIRALSLSSSFLSFVLGTCAMKPVSDGGVVDNNLSVYGVKRLKVADLSIAPSNVNAKAAVIFGKELGIAHV